MKIMKNNHGMTIMEVIVTIMVLAVALTIITSGIFAANNLMNEGRRVQQSLDNQDSALHGETIDSVKIKEEVENFSFNVNDTTYTFSGKSKLASDDTSKDVSLQTYSTDKERIYGAEWDMFKDMQNMPDLFRSWTLAEKDEIIEELRKIGATASHFHYMNNDLFIFYVYHYIYNDNLPKLDDKYLPEIYKGNSTFYIHPFLAQPLETGENVLVYATTYSTHGVGNWLSFMVFDYGDGTDASQATGWYYHSGPNWNGSQTIIKEVSVNTLFSPTSTYKTWKEFRENVLLKEADGWKHVTH